MADQQPGAADPVAEVQAVDRGRAVPDDPYRPHRTAPAHRARPAGRRQRRRRGTHRPDRRPVDRFGGDSTARPAASPVGAAAPVRAARPPDRRRPAGPRRAAGPDPCRGDPTAVGPAGADRTMPDPDEVREAASRPGYAAPAYLRGAGLGEHDPGRPLGGRRHPWQTIRAPIVPQTPIGPASCPPPTIPSARRHGRPCRRVAPAPVVRRRSPPRALPRPRRRPGAAGCSPGRRAAGRRTGPTSTDLRQRSPSTGPRAWPSSRAASVGRPALARPGRTAAPDRPAPAHRDRTQ